MGAHGEGPHPPEDHDPRDHFGVRPVTRSTGRRAAVALGCVLSVALFEALPRFVPPLNRFVTFADASQSTWTPGSTFVWKGNRVGHLGEFRVRTRTNSLGFADREIPRTKSSGAVRVVVLGDSQVEALQVRLEDRFHKVLEFRLSRHEPRVEVVALGRSGFGAAEALETYHDLGRSFDPDLVIWGFTDQNDVIDADRTLQRRIWTASPTGLRPPPRPLDRSILATLAYSRRWRATESVDFTREDVSDLLPGVYAELARWWNLRDVVLLADPPAPFQTALDRFVRDVDALATAVRADGLPLIIVSTAGQDHVPQLRRRFPSFSWEEGKLDSIVAASARAHDARFLAMKPAFRSFVEAERRDVLFPLDGHLNEEGHGVVASVLYPEVALALAIDTSGFADPRSQR